MSKILVTGGCGFIGTNFIRYALEQHSDISIVNLSKSGCASGPNNLTGVDNRRCRHVVGDIADFSLVSRLVDEVDAIVNFAGESHVDRSISSALPFFTSNTEGVIALLEALRRQGRKKRLIQISSDEVYGGINSGSFTEKDRTRPSSPYAASKAAAEAFCFAYHRTYGIDVIICRSANNFGPYQFPEKLIPKTIIRAKLGLKVPLYGSGKNVREWIYVEDHCRAIDILLNRGSSGEVYNVATGEELTNIEVVNKILEVMGKNEDLLEFVDDRPGHDTRYSIDASKLRNEVGWKPRSSFNNVLASTIRWYLDNEVWWKRRANKSVLHPTPWKIKW